MAQKIEVKSKKGLEKWLNNRPEAARRKEATIVTSRIALRLLPFIEHVGGLPASQFAELSMAVFRANMTSRAASGILLLENIGLEHSAGIGHIKPAFHLAQNLSARVRWLNAMAAGAGLVAAYSAELSFPGYSDGNCIEVTASAAANSARVDTDTWITVSQDFEFMASQGFAALFYRPLWLGKTPDWWPDALQRLKAHLSARPSKEHWSVWTDWYESVARGGPAFGLPAAIAADLEKRIALGDGRDDFWDRPPAAINAEIAGWVAAARQTVSEGLEQQIDEQALRAKPASIETAIEDGVIDLSPAIPTATLDKNSLRAAARDMANELGQLADLAKAKNADQRHVGLLTEAAEKVRTAPDNSVNLFASGRLHEALTTLSTQVNDEWDAPSAARYHAALLQFERTLKKFPDWRKFLEQPNLPTSAPDRARLIAAARDFIGSLEDIPSVVANRVHDAAKDLLDEQNALSALDDLYLADLAESCLNILRSAAQGFLAIYGNGFVQQFTARWPEVPKAHAGTLITILKGPSAKVLAGLIGTWWAGSTGWLSAIWDFIAKLAPR